MKNLMKSIISLTPSINVANYATLGFFNIGIFHLGFITFKLNAANSLIRNYKSLASQFIFFLDELILLIIIISTFIVYGYLCALYIKEFTLGLFYTSFGQFYFILMLLLPLFSKELSVFLLNRSCNKSNFIKVIINTILLGLFNYFNSYLKHYLNLVIAKVMQYPLLCLLIDFGLAVVEYYQNLNISTKDKLGAFILFGLLASVPPPPYYYSVILVWYFCILAKDFINSNKNLLSLYPVIKTWANNVLTINIIVL